MMGTMSLDQTDRNPLQFCPVCYRKLHKCINFEHVQRAKALTAICDEFGGDFTKKNQYEINCQSYRDFYAGRYDKLSKAIKPDDYNIDPRGNKTASTTAPNLK